MPAYTPIVGPIRNVSACMVCLGVDSDIEMIWIPKLEIEGGFERDYTIGETATLMVAADWEKREGLR